MWVAGAKATDLFCNAWRLPASSKLAWASRDQDNAANKVVGGPSNGREDGGYTHSHTTDTRNTMRKLRVTAVAVARGCGVLLPLPPSSGPELVVSSAQHLREIGASSTRRKAKQEVNQKGTRNDRHVRLLSLQTSRQALRSISLLLKSICYIYIASLPLRVFKQSSPQGPWG